MIEGRMRKDSLAFAVSGIVFGLLVGWIVGTQQVPDPVPATPPASAAAPAPSSAPALDQARAQALEQQAAAEPSNVAVRMELASLYFDAERYAEAGPWYEQALAIDPDNADANAGVSLVYYAQGQPDRGLAHIDRALAVDPNHSTALLNQGIIRAFGKRDLAGAEESWSRVVATAPGSVQAQQAARGLEALRQAHQLESGAGGAAP
jgi:tetratricopeptide (TPR) repeat protein